MSRNLAFEAWVKRCSQNDVRLASMIVRDTMRLEPAKIAFYMNGLKQTSAAGKIAAAARLVLRHAS